MARCDRSPGELTNRLRKNAALCGLPSQRRPALVPPGAGWHSEGRVEAVKEVGDRHHQHQGPELLRVVVPSPKLRLV